MTMDVAAFAIIGIKVSSKVFENRKATRGCKHPVKMGAKFCPQCGKLTWDISEDDVPKEEIFRRLPDVLRKVRGVTVVDSGDGNGNGATDVHIGFVVGEGSRALFVYPTVKDKFSILDLARIKKLRDILHQCFPDSNFGIRAVLCEDY